MKCQRNGNKTWAFWQSTSWRPIFTCLPVWPSVWGTVSHPAGLCLPRRQELDREDEKDLSNFYFLELFAFSSSKWKNWKMNPPHISEFLFCPSPHISKYIKHDNFMSNQVIHNTFYVIKCIK